MENLSIQEWGIPCHVPLELKECPFSSWKGLRHMPGQITWVFGKKETSGKCSGLISNKKNNHAP